MYVYSVLKTQYVAKYIPGYCYTVPTVVNVLMWHHF